MPLHWPAGCLPSALASRLAMDWVFGLALRKNISRLGTGRLRRLYPQPVLAGLMLHVAETLSTACNVLVMRASHCCAAHIRRVVHKVQNAEDPSQHDPSNQSICG